MQDTVLGAMGKIRVNDTMTLHCDCLAHGPAKHFNTLKTNAGI